MRINNFGEFKTFLVENKLDDLNAETADFIACVMQYNVLCSCKKLQKIQKHELCNQQYINLVSNILPKQKDIIFSKIQHDLLEFYYNYNFHISSMLR